MGEVRMTLAVLLGLVLVYAASYLALVRRGYVPDRAVAGIRWPVSSAERSSPRPTGLTARPGRVTGGRLPVSGNLPAPKTKVRPAASSEKQPRRRAACR